MNKPKPKMSPELERFLAESAIKERLYHGTTKDIKQFSPSHIGANDFGWYGRGHYLTADPGTASAYSDYAKVMETGKLQNAPSSGANVMPLHVQARNPYYWPEGRKVATNKKEAESLTNELKALGHDSVIVSNKYQEPKYMAHHEVIMFHPNQIKSAIGNRGTYDLNEMDITKAKGGLVHMDKGGRPPQQMNLDMARESAERIGQHHDPFTRSLQQGYEHGWYHGSTGDIEAFDPNTRGESTGAASAKKGYFFARDPSTPPPEMIEHNPESLAMLQKIGATIPPKPTMVGHGAHTASSYAGTGGSREYKEAMRMAKAAEKIGNWNAYEKYMQLAEDAEINNMRYRQDLVAKHGDARDLMYDQIKNAWYGAHNAEMFKKMSQPDYEAHDKRYKELMPYGWHINYEKPHYEMLKAELQKFGDNKQVKSALNAINHYQSVHNERKAAEVESGANVMPVALRYKNPMYHDFKGSSYRDETYSDLLDQAMRGGHDALILKNTYDPGGIGKPKMVDVGVVFHPNQIRSKFAAFDPTRKDESHLLAAKGGVVSMLRKHGRPVESDLDAMHKMSNGHRVFIAHEQDEIPTEIHRVSDMHGYTPDQIYTIAPEHFIQHKADGGSMSGVNLYSPLNKSAESIPRTKGTGAEFMTELSKKPGFKKAEVEDRGLEALNALPKMTKEQFHAHLHSHPNPQITTKILRDESEKHYAVPHYPDENSYNDLHNVVDEEGRQVNIHPFRNRGEAQSHIEGLEERDNKTYHKDYKLPGGSNYQEHLYKYEPKDKSQFVANASHYGGEPNILASARTVDRNTPEGKKILHVEEIQSDWHQKGRDNGYKQNLSELPKNYKLEERNINNRREYLITDENGKLFSMGLSPESATNNALNNLNDGKRVPNAPFKKNWEEMVAKQLLKHAVENGYHGIALTPGDEQADRYNLAKYINELHLSGTDLVGYDHNGNAVIKQTGITPDNLKEFVGKRAAKKLLDQPKQGTLRSLTGEDLYLGEGMKEAYDKRLPNIFNDLGKKHGAKMHLHQIPVFKNSNHYANRSLDGSVFNVMDGNDNIISSHPTQQEANEKAKELNSTRVHYMPLTPELVQHVKKEGLPLYKKGGYVSNDLDTMKYELHMASGGSTLGATMRPSLAQMKFEMSKKYNPLDIQGVGANEAPDLSPKTYINPSETMYGKYVSPGGVSQSNGMPIGGVDQNPQQPGQQLTPQQPGQPPQPPQPGQPQGQQGQGTPPQSPQPTPPMGNMLSLTPQGQAMNAMGAGTPPPPPQNMAKGGEVEGEMEAPSKTVKAYKLFRVHEKHPGKLFPLFIGKHEPVEMGKWVSAEHIPTKGFAERPGWHAGELPMATHIGERGDPNVTAPTIRPHNQVWTEIEMPHDVDWQSEANRRGTNKQGKVIAREAHITDQVPHGGHYRYKTNPNMTGSWLIGGAMKVNRILSDAEVKKINKAAKSSDLPRKEPFDKKRFGFANGGMAEGGQKPKKLSVEEMKQHLQSYASQGSVKKEKYTPSGMGREENEPPLQRVIPKTKEEIEKIALRLAPQIAGQYTPQSEKTQKQFEREQTLKHDIQPIASVLNPIQDVNLANHLNKVMVGLPGDYTITNQRLNKVSGRKLKYPVDQQGGSRYGETHPNSIWASQEDAAQSMLNLANAASKQYGGADVLANHIKMGPDSAYYAKHYARAMLSAIESARLTKAQKEELTKLLREKEFGYGQFPNAPHLKNMEDIYAHIDFNPDFRRHVGALMNRKYATEPYNIISGADMLHATSEPELRNLETGVTGHSIGELHFNKPLTTSSHSTYSHDIPGKFLGKLPVPVPYELSFPDAVSALKNSKNPEHQKALFGSLKMFGARQKIDQQLVDEIGQYRDMIKKLTGKKKGGNVKVHKDMDTMRLELTQRKKVK